MSKTSVSKRGFVQSELKRAVDVLNDIPEGQVYLIPVRLDDCEVPQALRHLHWVDVVDDGAIPQLISSITSLIRGEGHYFGGTGKAHEFVLIRLDASDLNWAEIPISADPVFVEQQYEQSFKLVNFVTGADPIFDITIMNQLSTPAVLTHIGVQIVYTAHVAYAYGIPKTARIKSSDSYP